MATIVCLLIPLFFASSSCVSRFSSLASFENEKTNEKFNSGEKIWSYEAKKSDREKWCFGEKASDREEMRIEKISLDREERRIEKISLDREERREEEISKNEQRKIFFSLSHSGGLCAITLSDECEVGVDIQSAPGRDTVERLQKKYFENASFAPENIKNRLLEAKIDGEKICFNEVSALPLKAADSKAGSALSDIASDDLLTRKFLESWVITEAILKCDGRGFSAMDQIEKLKSAIIYDVNSFVYNEKIFSISAAKVKNM